MGIKDYIRMVCEEKGHLAKRCPNKEKEEVKETKGKQEASVASWGENSDSEPEIETTPKIACLKAQSSPIPEEVSD